MRFVATVEGIRHVVEVDSNGRDRRVTLDGRELSLNWRPIGPRSARVESDAATHYGVLVGAHSYEAYLRVLNEPAEAGGDATPTLEVMIAGRPYVVSVQDARAESVASRAGGGHLTGDVTLRAPMPGLVRHVRVAVGDLVQRGQIVIVLEAMKMENDLAATRAGVVKSVGIATGQTVNQGDALVTIGDADTPADTPADAESDLPDA